jgi:hypothetical protein
MFDLVSKILEEQAPSGAFYTTVLHQGKRFQDENGLVTCLVLRELSKIPGNGVLVDAIGKGLDFLESCAAGTSRKAFHFYPPGREPKWLRDSQAPRADDTALIAMTLVKHGMMRQQEARRIVDVLDEARLRCLPLACSPWVKLGAYKAWLDEKVCPNRVDCCVNANIAAFLKFVGREDHPGYKAAVGTVVDGVRFASKSPSLTDFLSPYHPDPNELSHAMSRAVEAGVLEFLPLLKEARNSLKPMRRKAGLVPVCGSSDKQTLWFSHCLQIARTLTKFHGPALAVTA